MIKVLITDALHAYIPLHLAVKSSQPRIDDVNGSTSRFPNLGWDCKYSDKIATC